MEQDFLARAEQVKSTPSGVLPRSAMLDLYGLYKQATAGDNNTAQPWALQVEARTKWDAWMKNKGMPKSDAMRQYIQLADRLLVDRATMVKAEPKAAPSTAASEPKIATPGDGLSPVELSKVFSLCCQFVRYPGIPEAKLVPVTEVWVRQLNLSLYSFYKQALLGPCSQPPPPVFDVVAYRKWEAWTNCGNMSKEDAMRHYIEMVTKRVPRWREIAESEAKAKEAAIKATVKKPSPTQPSLASFRELLTDEKAFAAREAYLVTGVTGFIGKHLADLLLKRPGAYVIALVREQSREKMMKMAVQRWGPAAALGVVTLVGDISKPLCGLNDDVINGLKTTSNIKHFFHIAASYDLSATEEENERNNVTGTLNVVELANRLNVPLQYTSSIVVAGDYSGTFLESMYDEGQTHGHPYYYTKFKAEGIVRTQAKCPYRIYRPGIVVGSSETGEAEKIDGPYYFFRTLQTIRSKIPSFITLPCIRGGPIPIVPVDYVVKAMNHIAFQPGLDGKAFCLVDPRPTPFIDLLNEFAKAAHCSQFSSRLPDLAGMLMPQRVSSMLAEVPDITRAPFEILAGFLHIPMSAFESVSWPTSFDDSETRAALHDTGIVCPPISEYAWRLWDYYERHLDPALDPMKALMGELRGRVVVITGASDGIGLEIAKRVAAVGAKTVLVARTIEKLEAAKAEIESAGGTAFVYSCDLSEEEAVDTVTAAILADHGRVDYLINNAGRSIRRSVEYQYDRLHDFKRCIALNYIGSLKLILAFLPRMREQKMGHIINISSIGVQTNQPRFSAYVASKSALDAFCRCISSEIASDNVLISTVYMPLVRTKMIAPTNSIYKHFPTLSPEEAADMALRPIITKEKKIASVAGTVGEVLYALAPNLLDRILNLGYRLMPEKKPGEDALPEPSKEAILFAHAMKELQF